MNPMGCQKGACWSHCLYSKDRVTDGEREDQFFWWDALGHLDRDPAEITWG